MSPKRTGIGDNLYIAGYDISGDVGAVDTISAARTVLDVTAIDKSAPERIGALADGTISFSSWWDTTALAAFDALSALPTTDVVVTYVMGTAAGDPCAMLNAKQIGLDISRGADGSLGCKTSCQANAAGLDWGVQLTTGKQTFASAGSGTAVNFLVGSLSFGATAYFHLFSIGSGSFVLTIEGSANGSTGWGVISGLTFTSASARTFERKATTTITTAVAQYLRATLTGTFTNAVCHVGVVRYPVAQA